MSIITASELSLILAVRNLAGSYKDEALKQLEEITQEMAKDKASKTEISLLFAQNNEYFNSVFSQIAEIYGYEIQQKEKKFFLAIPTKD